MRQSVGIACIVMLVGGCATRPATGPGSGVGADYVPMVETPAVAPTAYDDDVAKCQASARSIPFRADEHNEALAVLDTAVIGTVVSTGLGIYTVIATGWTGGAMGGFGYWMYSPQRATWRAKQETSIANCMARKGYVNTDPSVKVTWIPPSQRSLAPPRATGVDTYNAEKLVKSQRCGIAPLAALVAKGPGFERYSVACANGQVVPVRCEFGNCRISQTVATAR
ncbi:hypothetical protein [Variovorax sp. PBL-E5]|uniref:hypothetical protein n=1 Tax=Variovorax sp. PBL-E5 TaxID=434014 RepID=UPI00131768E1|nr:hypothetical protein [Variovorax sp. PBL-E5]VTU16455.1 hypothetical protein E5CHR_00137 [Variovorax sp. PBL-E5]